MHGTSFRTPFTRPGWIHPGRSAAAFWMPTAVVLGMTLLLVLLWPHRPRRAAHARSLPEAMSAYVLLGSYQVLPGNPLGPAWPGPGGSTLPERGEDAAARRLPPPEYAEPGSVQAWTPVLLGIPPATPPSLATRPVSAVLTGIAPATNVLALTLSPGLERSGFRFDVPSSVATGMPAVARFQVELDAQGEVVHFLAEPCDNPAAARLLETAVSRGRGTRAGRGQVTVSWGK